MNDGGPAFPEQVVVDGDGMFRTVSEFGIASGMSLLDWFAGMAMQGGIAALQETDDWPPSMRNIAERSYQLAATMIAERERRMKE